MYLPVNMDFIYFLPLEVVLMSIRFFSFSIAWICLFLKKLYMTHVGVVISGSIYHMTKFIGCALTFVSLN